jgi:hypothetical protein
LDKKKIIISFIILIVIVASIFIYQNYTLESITTNVDNTEFFDEEKSSENDTISEDIGFPNTIILSWPDDVIDYSNVTFTWTGEDDVTQTEDLLYAYKLEGENDIWSSWTNQTSKTYTNLPNGEYTFFVKAKDQAGNIDLIPIEELFTVNVADNEPETKTYYVYWPIVAKNLPLNDTCFAGKKQPFLKTISIPQNNLKQITFQINWEDDFTTPLLHFGKDILTFTINSSEDNELYSEKSRGKGTLCFNISNINQKPTITQVEAEDLKTAQTMIQQYFGTNLTDEPFHIEVEIKIGELRILRRLRDQGNEFTLKITYEYYEPEVSEVKDNPPETSITSGPSGTTHEKYVKFSWKGTDDFTSEDQLKYSYKLEPYEKTWSEWTTETSINYEELTKGSYTFFVKTKDHRGNIDPTPAERSFIVKEKDIDNSPPNTEILTGPEGSIMETTVTFTWTGADDKTSTENLRYSFKLEGKDSSWSSWTSDVSKTYADLSDGEYIFKVKAKDTAGNIDPTPAEQSFTIGIFEPDRFATSANFSGGGSTDLILGGPRGKGEDQGSSHVLSLGTSGIVTVAFDVTIINGPGKDFIIFENPFSILDQYGEPTGMVFAELVYIEVSTDGINFARFPSTSITADPVSSYQGIYPENVTNLAGVHPVYANVDNNDLDPFDPDEAGGDAFDLEDLCNHPLVQNGLVDLHDINYLRIIDILGDGSCLDSQDNPIYDPTGPGNNGADIDAVSVINYLI